jgi:hypothetical protein
VEKVITSRPGVGPVLAPFSFLSGPSINFITRSLGTEMSEPHLKMAMFIRGPFSSS